MTSSTSDITGLREQIKENAAALWPGNISLLLIKRDAKCQAILMRTDERLDEQVVANSAGRETACAAYEAMLEVVSCMLGRQLEEVQDKIMGAHMIFGPPTRFERQEG